MLLLTFEGAIRRDVSIAIKERIIQVGLVFIVLLFGFVMYSDLMKKIASG
jgi:membrane-associated protease RseP (regulator of RpoE activity)